MRFEIEPKIGLGEFILGMNINQVLTLIKRNGYNYKHCEIISGKEINTPTFFHIPSEQITLRFNYYSQNLELIEKKITSLDNIKKDKNNSNNKSFKINIDSEYYYKNKLFYTLNKESHFYKINYQNIAKIFGLSKVPKKLNNNKNIFLEYSGIGFFFINIEKNENENLDISVENSSVNTESILNKIYIFREDSLYDSINNSRLNKNNLLIKFDTKRPKSITVINDESECEVSIGDHIEDVLRKLKHPNYIYYNNEKEDNNQENGDALYNQTSNSIYYLNYFQYGFDIMISNNTVNRIILHTNQVNDSKFGIYDRCNFKLKLRNDYLKTLIEDKSKRKDSSENNKGSRKSSYNEKESEKIIKKDKKNNEKSNEIKNEKKNIKYSIESNYYKIIIFSKVTSVI